MTGYELYTFLLCLFVFVVFVSLFSVMIGIIVKLTFMVIRNGLYDEKIKIEVENKSKKKKVTKIIDTTSNIVSIISCAVFVCLFIFSLSIGFNESKTVSNIPVLKVVQSQSMSEALDTNKYLKENNLTNQIQMFDIVIIEQLPNEADLNLYDIVVYEPEDDVYVIHRIVGIEKPNDKHNDYHYRLQGDAVQSSDRYPVTYDQMKGIYTGKRIKYLGSLVMFLQSPAGWLCIILILFYLFATPIIEKKMTNVKKERLSFIDSN